MKQPRPARDWSALDALVLAELKLDTTWRKRAEIRERVGCRDNELRAAVARLIEAGQPIATAMSHGYKLTDSPLELEESAQEGQTKIVALSIRVQAQRRTAERMRETAWLRPAQQNLFDNGHGVRVG